MIGPVTRIVAWLALLLQFLWPRYLFLSVAGKGVSGYTALTILLLLAAIGSFFVRRRLQANVLDSLGSAKLLVGVFALLWIWRLMCDLFAGQIEGAAIATLIDFLYLGSWFISGLIVFSDARLRNALPYVIAISGITACAVGIIEYRTGTPISRMYGFSSFAVGDSYQLDQIGENLSRGGQDRIRSLFSHPLVYGQIMGGLVPFSLFLIFSRRIPDKFLGLLLGAAIAVSIFLCNARSPWIVAGAGGMAFVSLYLFDPRRKIRLFLAMLLLLGATIAAPIAIGFVDQLQSGRTREEAISSGARTAQANRGFTALRNSPILGFGHGSAVEYAATLSYGGRRSSVDNYYLTTAVETGYVGLGIFCFALLAMMLQGLHAIYASSSERERSLSCAAVSTIIALSSGLFVLSIMDSLSVIFSMAGLLAASSGATVIARRQRRRALTYAAEARAATAS